MSRPAPTLGPATAKQQRQLHALYRLAQDASQYLRRHAAASVRVAAALLLAASLAACNASATDTTMVETRAVAPLSQEVVSGLPRGPGTYSVVRESVFRDQRGVYQLEWQDQGADPAAQGHVAHVSRLRLIRDDTLALEMPPDGGDPVLHLPADENVGLIEQAQVGATQAGPVYYPSPYSYWHPFGYGPSVILLGRPAYYDPPRTIVVDRSPSTSGTSGPPLSVDGGSVSETAKPPSARVTGVTSAVSGRAGGTGSGSAVTSRNASSGASSASGSTGSASSSSAARSGTSGSTSGSSSSSGVTSSSGARSGTSGGSVSAPKSGGFSAGGGSSGGSAAS